MCFFFYDYRYPSLYSTITIVYFHLFENNLSFNFEDDRPHNSIYNQKYLSYLMDYLQQ